ncbi:hypothetical protein ROV86_07210 [Stenotrophomonas pavanii]|nr:hypothetical protein [Stenotrophomonas pavanii]MDT3527892.1 hypothetical protein [Stenotrophomonas pavanii]
MRRIELFYQDAIFEVMDSDRKAGIKAFRANYLREFVVSKKQEFNGMNAKLAVSVHNLLETLAVEYDFQKTQFKARGF